MIAVYNDLIFVKHGRTAEAVHAREWPGPHQPSLVSIKIISRNQHLGFVEEGHVNEFAVGRRSAGGVAVERMFAFHWRGDDRFLPENPSIGAVQTEKDARLLLRNGCDREDAIVPNNRRGVTKPGQLGFP